MMAPKPKDWKLYERLVAAVQAKLATSDSEVTWNETVVGRSGTPRQLDVLVRGRVGTAPVTVVVECKEYAEHVGIEIVDAFVGKLKDVDGTQGILVARTGFTKPALMRAEQERIITAVLRPAKDEDWEGYLRSMCLRVVTKVLVHGELKVEDTDGTTRPAPGIVLLNGEGGVYRFLTGRSMPGSPRTRGPRGLPSASPSILPSSRLSAGLLWFGPTSCRVTKRES